MNVHIYAGDDHDKKISEKKLRVVKCTRKCPVHLYGVRKEGNRHQDRQVELPYGILIDTTTDDQGGKYKDDEPRNLPSVLWLQVFIVNNTTKLWFGTLLMYIIQPLTI
jgi:hypothetical protein